MIAAMTQPEYVKMANIAYDKIHLIKVHPNIEKLILPLYNEVKNFATELINNPPPTHMPNMYPKIIAIILITRLITQPFFLFGYNFN